MQSFAFWYESDTQLDNVSAKMNFNLWTECKWGKKDYLDIGFLLTNWSGIKMLNFYVPFKINSQNIDDLGNFLKKPELACAIFNENLQPSPEESKKDFLIKNIETNEEFLAYGLDTKFDIKILPYNEDEGSIIKINLEDKKLDSTKKLYFRFRIKNADLSNLIKKYSSDKSGLQSVLNTTYTIDFRFFNKRSLNKTLLEKINQSYKMPIESIHFLVITKTYVNLITSNCQGRKLEESVWNEYINDTKKNTKELIAYHFKEKFRKKDNADNTEWDNKYGAWDVFIKYTVEKSIWWLYILISLLLGSIGSFICTIFCKFVLNWN